MHLIAPFAATRMNQRRGWFVFILLCAGGHLAPGAAKAQDATAANVRRIELGGNEVRPPIRAEGPSRNGGWHGKVIMRVATGEVLGSSDFIDGVEHGEYLEYYPNGRLHLRKRMADGAAEGIMVKYYPDGTKQCEISMVKGSPTGLAKVYWPNGRLYMQTVQIDGRADGEAQLWRPNGQPLAIEVHRRGSLLERKDLSPIDAAITRELERSAALRDFRGFWDRHLAQQGIAAPLEQRRQQAIDDRVRGDMAQFESELVVP